jgi:putative chitinase
MNIQNLKGHIPDAIIAQLKDVMDKFKINTVFRLSHFIGQAMHESGNFKKLNENLNYSGDRLMVIFPKYFKGKDVSLYNRNPQKIANLVYGSRMGNGNEASGEGYKFHGRGAFQLTGKSNYIALGKAIGEDLVTNPDLVATKYSLLSAAWFFSTNNLNVVADKGITKDVITSVTKKINGGTIGLEERIKETNLIYNLIK